MATVYEQGTPFTRGAKPPHLNATISQHQEANSGGATTMLTSLSAKTSPWGGSHNISGYNNTPSKALTSAQGGGLSTPLQPTTKITTPHSTGGIRKDTGVDTSIIPRPEPPTQHIEQLCPPPQAFELAHKVYQRP